MEFYFKGRDPFRWLVKLYEFFALDNTPSLAWFPLPLVAWKEKRGNASKMRRHQSVVKLTVLNRQTKVSMVSLAVALIIKALKEPELDRKKMKNIKHNKNISLDNVNETAKVMHPRSMAKDLSGTVKFGPQWDRQGDSRHMRLSGLHG
nr:60s ribosomal protein l12-3 [Quercus suber]